MTMQLGWKAGPEQYPPNELLTYAREAERAGFDILDVSDHFHPWSPKGQACFTWSWLGAAAVQTERIVLGTGLTCPFLRYHPSVVAQATATMSQLAPDRFYLGIGTGEALNEYSSMGKWPPYETRRKMMIESVQLIRMLLDGDEVSFSGEYFTTNKAKLYTPPKGKIPIFVSSLVPNSAATAGKYGDGLLTVGGGDVEVYQEILLNFENAISVQGRDLEDAPKMIELGVAYTDNKKETIHNKKKYWAGASVPAVYNERIYSPEAIEANGAVVGSDFLKENMCISSDPEDHVDYVKDYINMGFTHIIFHYCGPDQGKFLRDYGEDVLPLIRQEVEVPMQKSYF